MVIWRDARSGSRSGQADRDSYCWRPSPLLQRKRQHTYRAPQYAGSVTVRTRRNRRMTSIDGGIPARITRYRSEKPRPWPRYFFAALGLTFIAVAVFGFGPHLLAFL